MMNWQFDQFTDQILVALDQLISVVLSPFVWFFQHPLADFCKWLFGPQIFTTGEIVLVFLIVFICAVALFYVVPGLAAVAVGAFLVPALVSMLGHVFHFGLKVLIIYIAIRLLIFFVKLCGKWIDRMLGIPQEK